MDELDFVWNKPTEQWEAGYSALKKYKETKGDCQVPNGYVTEDGYRIGRWVQTQREKQSKLSEDRRRRLDELRFVWDALTEKWEAGYSALKKYKEANGDCLVPNGYVTEDGYRIGRWVGKQREKQSKLSEDRRRRLDELGFVWDARIK